MQRCGDDSHQAPHTRKCWNGLLHNDKPEKKCCITASKMQTVLLFVRADDKLVTPPTTTTTAKEQLLVLRFLSPEFCTEFWLHTFLSTRARCSCKCQWWSHTFALLQTILNRLGQRLHVRLLASQPAGIRFKMWWPGSETYIRPTVAAVSRHKRGTQQYSVHSPYIFSHCCNWEPQE